MKSPVFSSTRTYDNPWTGQQEAVETKYIVIDGVHRPLIRSSSGKYYVSLDGKMHQVNPETGEISLEGV